MVMTSRVSFKLMKINNRSRLVLALCILLSCPFSGTRPAAAQGTQLTFDQPQCAGISGLRPFWDRPVVLAADGLTETTGRGNILNGPRAVWGAELRWHRGLNYWIDTPAAPVDPRPGALAFDAVHRSLLVRFPGAAEAIAAKLGQGWTIRKAEIVLPYKGAEKLSIGYKEPSSFIGNMWDKNEPYWHAVAWALRQPWQADAKLGPTFNASINGVRYWAKYGAADETHDRFPNQFGPAEISSRRDDGLDITASLTDPAYGADLGARLRRLSDCGYLVRKEEYYDAHFTTPGYEWAVATGGRGIMIDTPNLVITFAPGKAAATALPPPADFAALSQRKSGAPTAVLPDAAQFEKLRVKYTFANLRPTWMPDWQWQRVTELYNLGGEANTFPDSLEDYDRWIDRILATPPRNWEGFNAADQLMLYYDYKDALPAYIGDHWRLYWTAWLMPWRDTWDMTHNQYHQIWTPWRGFGSDYVDRTDDWRGDKSFYRESYTRYMSTMNFNHTSAIGALLGGQFIGSQKAIDDGRYGLEMFPLRLWAWYDGTLQEAIDHYYLSITMTDQKTFADYGPTEFDRLMGRSILAKSMEELATCYHPALRRFISPGGRTTPFYATQEQDGVMHIAHTMTRDGALTDTDKAAAREHEVRAGAVGRVPIIGHDLPPRRVAMQTLKSPWAPEWMSEVFEDKPLPFQVISTFRQWGAFRTEPKWKVSYMGANYGLASYDYDTTPTLNLQGLWKRVPGKLTTADDLGQLLVRFGYNRTNFIDTMKGGTLGNMGGTLAVLQHKGKMLIASSPNSRLSGSHFDPAHENIKSIQTSICLFTLQDKPTWRIFVDGNEVTALPFTCRAGAHITIQDGISFVGVIPLQATDLGRDAEIAIKAGGPPVAGQSGEHMSESLLIESYFYRGDKNFDLAANDKALDAAYGGFEVELGDTAEYKDFAAFQAHIGTVAVTQKFDDAKSLLHLSCKTGDDLLEMGFVPVGADSDSGQLTSAAVPYRRVNGAWPYLPDGIERDTPLSVLGRRGDLQKNGAHLRLEPGQMGYLLTEPHTGTYLAANPLPDASWFHFALDNGPTLEADGRIGLGLFTLNPAKGQLDIQYSLKPGQDAGGMATCLAVGGLDRAPSVTLNGAPLPVPSRRITVGAKALWLVPLAMGADLSRVDAGRIQAARVAADKAFAAGSAGTARLVYEKGEHYLLTRPGNGVWSFQRQWPSGVDFRAETPEGVNVSADGRLPIVQLTIDAKGRVDLFAPKYLYDATSDGQKFDNKATALLVFGTRTAPAVVLNGKAYQGPMPPVELDGKQAWLVPLYGTDAAADARGLADRYHAAMTNLPAAP